MRETGSLCLLYTSALKDLNVGDTVFKYGTDIGKVVKPIRQGEHLHVTYHLLVLTLWT